MSGLEVIGGLSAIISIINASIKIYDSARKDLKLSETFDTVGCRLPIILEILQKCENYLRTLQVSLPADACEALERLLENCYEKATRLKQIFEKVIPGEHDAWKTRHLKVVRRFGKGNTVADLMLSITEDVQLVVNHRALHSAKTEETAELQKIIVEMESIKPSIPKEQSCAINFNSDGGSGSGQQINNNSPVATQTFNPVIKQKKDFSFRQSVGAHLCHAPHLDPTLFIGRSREIEEMKRILKPGNRSHQQRRLVLGGMGGVGKTQLAIAYASHCQNDYESVFWLDAKSEATLKESFRKGAIVVTTRLPHLVAGGTIRLQPLGKIEESLEILQTRSQRKNVASDSHAKKLAERLAGLPLALAIAGAYLRQSSFTFERYLQEYENRFNIDPQRTTTLQEYQDRSLYTTWSLSYAHLQRHNPNAAKLLELLAYFDNQSIWYELLRGGFTDDSSEWLHEAMIEDIIFDGIMRTLTEYCFVEVQTALKSWSMHACVHDWTRASFKTNVDAQKYWYAFDSIAKSINADDWYSFGHLSYGRVAAHATRLVQDGFRQDGFRQDDVTYERLEKAYKIAELLREQAQLTAAEEMLLLALAGSEEMLGFEDELTLNFVNNLGNVYRDLNELATAEQMLVRALVGKENALGPEHTSTLDTAKNLGVVYRIQGRLVEAEQMHSRALAGYEKAWGAKNTHHSTLQNANSLGNLYRDQGRLGEAKQMFLRALDGYEMAFGAKNTNQSTLGTVNNLGTLYHNQGRLGEAEQMYSRALAGYEKAFGTNNTHEWTLKTVDNLGMVYEDQGRLGEAEQMYSRALAGFQETLGSEHSSTKIAMRNMERLALKKQKHMD